MTREEQAREIVGEAWVDWQRGEVFDPDCWKAVTDDNEADAIALLHYALTELVPAAPCG